MSIYHFDILTVARFKNGAEFDLPTDDAARRYGQQLANGLRPVWLAVDGEKRTFVQLVDENGNAVARSKVET